MSLYIQIDDVSAVLLADGWHDVLDQSFDLDAYEYLTGSNADADADADAGLLYNGERQGSSTGFTFLTDDRGPSLISGPITSILAVRRE